MNREGMDNIDMFWLLFKDGNRKRKSKGWPRVLEPKLNDAYTDKNNKKNKGKKYIPSNYNEIEMCQLLYEGTTCWQHS